MNSVTLHVPASTSNLGPGFDTLGLAVNLFNTITFSRRIGRGIVFTSDAGESDSAGGEAMAVEAAQQFFRKSRRPRFGVDIESRSTIPIGRGLGASGALRAGIVAGLNLLSGANRPRAELLGWLTELEHHPDNVSPALFGGFTVSTVVGREVRCLRFPVRRALHLVTLLPDFKVLTEEARRIVPKTFSKADTVHSLNRAAFITAAFAAKDYSLLRGVFDDRLHQPARTQLVPRLNAVIRAGERAGAIGGFLSGSGSAIICLTESRATEVAAAMHRAMPASAVKILHADNQGLRIQS